MCSRQSISGFLFTFIAYKLREHLVRDFTVSKYKFKFLFNNYDVTTSIIKFIQPHSELYKAPNQSLAK